MAKYLDERGDRVSPEETEKVVKVTPVEARQGFLGRPVLMVLGAGLILAAIAWAVAEGYGEATDNDAATQSSQGSVVEPDAAPSDQPATGTEAQPAEGVDRNPAAGSGTQSNEQPVAPEGTEQAE